MTGLILTLIVIPVRMVQMPKWVMIGFLCILSLVIGLFIGIDIHTPTSPVVVSTVTTDTLYVPSAPQVIWKTAYIDKIVLDTVIVCNNDTIVINNDTIRVAKDTVSFKEGSLQTWYYYLPVNQFKYNWNPNPKEVITITKIASPLTD